MLLNFQKCAMADIATQTPLGEKAIKSSSWNKRVISTQSSPMNDFENKCSVSNLALSL